MTKVENEDITSQNNDVSGEQQDSEVTNQDVKTLDAEALKEQNRQLFERAKKAEGLVKELRTKVPKEETKTEAKAESNESEYARLAKMAYFKSEGVNHPDDIKVIEDEAARLKLSPDVVLQMEHIKGKLKTNADTRNAQNGMPTGSNRSGGATQQDVDYWLSKGGLPEDNQELAEKIVNARMGKDTSQRRFDPIR